jgi:ribose transport system substrate-binding protein
MKLSRQWIAVSAVAVAAVSLGGGTASAQKYVIGVSNTLTGNGWREEMICSIKAQAAASGMVSKVVVANRNGGPPEQIQDLRNLISAGVNAIIVNPSDREALNPVIKQAADKGIVVVAVDQAVSAPEAYVLSNDQVAYAKLGAEWLFKQLGGKGNVIEMRGIDGVPADADRHDGFNAALKNLHHGSDHRLQGPVRVSLDSGIGLRQSFRGPIPLGVCGTGSPAARGA